jgi:beta-glucosidase
MAQQLLSGQYVRPSRGRRPPGGAAPRAEETFGPSDCFVGRYFAGRSLERLVQQRQDCRIAFDWGSGPPTGIEGLSVDDFSVRWEGTLRAPATDEYVFYLASDDGSRLFLDGKKLLDEWTEHGFAFIESPPIKLTQGTDYPITVEFFEAKELAMVRLEWSSSTLPRQPLSGRYVSAPAGTDASPSRGQPPSR